VEAECEAWCNRLMERKFEVTYYLPHTTGLTNIADPAPAGSFYTKTRAATTRRFLHDGPG